MPGTPSIAVRAAAASIALLALSGLTGCMTLTIDRDVAVEESRSTGDSDRAPKDTESESESDSRDQEDPRGDADAGGPVELPSRLSFEAGSTLPEGLEVALGSSFSNDPEWVPESDPYVTMFTHAPTGCWVGFTSAEYTATSPDDLVSTRDFLETELGFSVDPAYESYPLFPFDPSGEKGGDPWGSMEFLAYGWDDATVPSFGYTSARVIDAANMVIVIDLSCPAVDTLEAEFVDLQAQFSIGLIPAGVTGT
jgi:hypothetical protein